MDATEAAARLCTACGMCCDGTLFEIVNLQPSDSISSLEHLGMKLRRKKRSPYFTQPCVFLHDCVCGIYEHRPQRCRAFVCRQLARVLADPASESEALEHVGYAHQLVDKVKHSLSQVGEESTHLPLAERCRAHPQTTANTMADLEHYLKTHFLPEDPTQ